MSAIVLTDGAVSVDLGDQLAWVDEFDWSPVEQNVSRSLTGASIVQVSRATSGQPITLEGSEDRALQPLAVVAQLREWYLEPEKTLQLQLRGLTHEVMFRHQDKPAMTAEPLFNVADPQAGVYPFVVTLKLMVI